MTANELIVAVDGGNSKTDVLLLRADGTVLASVRGAGSSPHQLGLEPAMRVVGDLVDRAWLASGLPARDGSKAAVAAVFMAGADLPSEEAALADAVAAQGWAEQNHVANDVFAVLWAATGTGYGVAVTVGAGVNCVGTAPSGRRAWFPALGDITGDWGGGPDIGMAALGRRGAQRGWARRTDDPGSRGRRVLRLRNRARRCGRDSPGQPRLRPARRAAAAGGQRRRGGRCGSARDHAPPGD